GCPAPRSDAIGSARSTRCAATSTFTARPTRSRWASRARSAASGCATTRSSSCSTACRSVRSSTSRRQTCEERRVSLGPLMVDLRGTSIGAEEHEWLESPLVAGVILFKRNFEDREQLERLVADIHAVREPPLLVAVDQEGGRVQRFREPFFRLPPMRALGRLYDRDPAAGLEAARAFGWLMAAELRAVGVDLSFAPVVDLDLKLADVIGDRALHRSAEVTATLARRFVAGASAAGMAATAKHFPTHA